jgi:hypothetical protein
MPRFLTRRRLIGAGGALALTPLLGDVRPVHAGDPMLPAFTPPGPMTALMPPVRAFDSRGTVFPATGAKLQPGESIAVTVPAAEFRPNEFGVAVILNCTVTQTEKSGYLIIRGSDLTGERPLPATSSINWWGPGQTMGNLVFCDVGGEFAVEVHNGGAGATHFIIDVQGFVVQSFATTQTGG